MSSQLPDPRELGFYYALSQVGLEMVAPIGLGAGLDHWLESGPWFTIAGAVLGLVGGMTHLVTMLNRREREQESRKRDAK